MILLDIFLNIVSYLLHIYGFFLVVAAVLSFVGAHPSNPIVVFFRSVTTPPCRYLVRKFPKLIISTENGYIDLSPLVLLLSIGCTIIIIQKIGYYLGIYL